MLLFIAEKKLVESAHCSFITFFSTLILQNLHGKTLNLIFANSENPEQTADAQSSWDIFCWLCQPIRCLYCIRKGKDLVWTV